MPPRRRLEHFESRFTYCPSQELAEARDQLEEAESRRLKVRPDKRYYHINQMIMMILSIMPRRAQTRALPSTSCPSPPPSSPQQTHTSSDRAPSLLVIRWPDKDKDKDKDICLSSGGQAPRALKSKSLFSGLERTRWRPACSFPWRGLQSRSGRRAGRGRVGPILQVVKPLDL